MGPKSGFRFYCEALIHAPRNHPNNTVKANPCFRYGGKTGEEHNLVIFKDKSMNSHINGELSTRPFH